MDDTEPYRFTWFGAMDDIKPCRFIWFGAMDDTKSYKFTCLGAMDDAVISKDLACARKARGSGMGRAHFRIVKRETYTLA